MVDINSKEEIFKLDSQNVLGSIDALPDQCLDAWNEAGKVEVPELYKDINNVIMCGMGGSGLGARVIESIFQKDLKVPLIRVNDYELPGFTDSRSLVICSSYSGETEETIKNANEAIEKKAKWMAIGTGGKLIDMAIKNNIPFYKINPVNNPSKQPRMAVGYSIVGQLVMASKAGLFVIGQNDIDESISAMNSIKETSSLKITDDNKAKSLASKIHNKIIFLVSSEHLVGSTHVVNNQLNENSKNLSADFFVPELNHHLMEGLKHPGFNPENVFYIFIQSDLYSERNKKRISITEDVVGKNNISFYEFKPQSPSKLSQSFELIQFGAYVNFYLSMLYNQDPAPIPWVDYFKTQLGQPLGK